MIFQRLNETLYFFWHHLTELLWRLLPVLPLLLFANYRFFVIDGGDPARAGSDPLMLLPQALAGVLAMALSIRYTLAVIQRDHKSLVQLWGAALDRSLALAAVQILAGFAIVAGFALLVVPGVFLLGVLMPASVIVVAEETTATTALVAAWARFRPQSWGVALGVMVLFLGLLVVLSGLDALGRLLAGAPVPIQVIAVSGLDLVGLLFSQLVGILLVRFYELERRQAA
ncbi:MAG TPA: hypothetical protein VFM34_07895 [Moraxellaceae bacterium]|nr:hypothetical protein [Moraxellaceae bacterium]